MNGSWWTLRKPHCLIGLGAGVVFHALSVRILGRRVPQYRVAQLPQKELTKMVAVAASEEIIWRAHGGQLETFLSSVGFGLTHLKIGSRQGAAHMAVFALLSQTLARKYGLATSIIFHSAYNLAHACESRRVAEIHNQ
ncbi:Uncharacterised protein [Mycobacteroides abscessus subsp. abscessus]|nr:Uncharacterised protein [Mycobacteroides abscessus subsp. abscessus]